MQPLIVLPQLWSMFFEKIELSSQGISKTVRIFVDIGHIKTAGHILAGKNRSVFPTLWSSHEVSCKMSGFCNWPHDCFIAWEILIRFFRPKYDPAVFDVSYVDKYSHVLTNFLGFDNSIFSKNSGRDCGNTNHWYLVSGPLLAWHVQVNIGFYFNFKIEKFVHSGLYAMWHHINSIFIWGVGHCFAWHVRVNLVFISVFKIEVLVHSGLCENVTSDITTYLLLPELKYYYEKWKKVILCYWR